jgi:hypothetical protein
MKKQDKGFFYIQNISKKTVLSITPDGTIIEENFVKDKSTQIWKRGKVGTEGYFTLENPELNKLLTANSETSLSVQECIKHPKCLGKGSLHRSTNIFEMKHEHNHETRFDKIRVMQLKQLLLRGAEFVCDKTLHEVFMDITIEEEYDDICHMLNYKTLEPSMRSRRKRNYPKVPHSAQDVDDLMKTANLDLSKYYRGLVKLEG